MLKRDLNFQNKFHFTSLGCARNLVDSEVMIGLLLKAGYELVQDPKEADFLVVNTCGFLEAARQEGIDTIHHLFQIKKKEAKVIVAGCMVQKNLDLLKETFPQVHYFLGSGDVEKIVEAIHSDQKGQELSQSRSYLEWGEVPRMISTPRHYAYLKIAEGCKKRCAFCIIPTIKGPLKSKTEDQLLKEFRALRSQGVFEIILIAQDLGDFGRDRGEKRALHRLLEKFLEEKGDFWLRLLYLYPDEIDDELIAIMKKDPRICPYIDMPIQHIDDQMLKAMHRTTSREEILQIITKLRKEVPNVQIRTSLMVGFPGETNEQFESLLTFLKEYPLDHVGVFSFSLEKEAYAASLSGQIPEEIKQKRANKLIRFQEKQAIKRNEQMIGKKLIVVVESYHPESKLLLQGRHSGQAPDVDGVVILNDFRKVEQFGALYEVEITDVAGYDLIGKVLRPYTQEKKSSCKLTLVSN